MILQEDAWLIQDPNSDLRIVGKFKVGKEVFVYKQVNDFYAVATPENGHAGYLLAHTLGITPLDPSSNKWVPAKPQKSIAQARILSVALPGAGYIYAEEYGKGITLMLLGMTSLIGGQAISEGTAEFVCRDVVTPDTCSIETDYSAARIGAALYMGMVAIGVWRSGAAVRRYRNKYPTAPRFEPVIGSNKIGVTLTMRLP